jgi:hydroxypyruvate isomerase
MSNLSRRSMLRSAVVLGAAAVSPGVSAAAPAAKGNVKNGRIKQSVVPWCFKQHWTPEQLIEVAAAIGLPSVELIDPKYWDQLKSHKMTCAIAGSHPFSRGWAIPDDWDYCTDLLTKRIDECKAFGVKTVITFTGIPKQPMSKDTGFANAVKGLKRILPHAEKQGVTLALEHLNSRVDENMKGHPGYVGDHMDWCIELCKELKSPAMKVLFDIYHVQIMDGDVIRRLHQHKDYIAHVHTAGNPGRNEIDETQEINYKPIMQALLEIGYSGFVGQEFIPTRNPLTSLVEAVQTCDV